MTEAMPFLQKAILLSYAPRPFGCGFLFRRVNMKKTIPMIYHGKEVSEKIYQARWLL